MGVQPLVAPAEQLVKDAKFLMTNGKVYNVAHVNGNQAASFSSAKVAAAKAATKNVALAGKVIQVAGAGVGAAVALSEAGSSGFSNQGNAKMVVGLSITTVGVACPPVGFAFALANVFGAFNGLYNNFSNKPNFGNGNPDGG